MIKSFRHKGLERFGLAGTMRGINPDQAGRLRLRLAALDTATTIDDMDIPGYRLHRLAGSQQGHWLIVVSGNWRITFSFVDSNAYELDLEDYH